VLWEALHEELLQPDTARVARLSERLAEVSSTIAMLAATPPAAASSPGDTPDTPIVDRRSPPPAAAGEPPAPDPRPGPDLRLASHPARPPRSPHEGERRSSLDPASFEQASTSEHPAATPEPASPEPGSSTESRGSGPPPPAALQPLSSPTGAYTFTKLVDEHHSPPPVEPVEPLSTQIEIRDVRREEGPSAWVSSVGRLLARHAEDGLPFAVLLVEIVDVAHLERSETPHDLHGLVAKVESGIGRAMRSSDHLSRETLGRYWLVAPETNGTGARMLAERLARLVRTSAIHRGVPMEVAIGIAVCPDDGTEAPALAARADLGVYSARATGRSIAHTDPPSAS
jgi:GGDEF domain-containing protein